MSELIEQLKLLNTPCRKTDALIAIALHEKRGPHWKDDLLCGGGYVVVMALIIWLSGGLK